MDCRVLKRGKAEITQNYNNSHEGIDLVGENYTLDQIIAHSDGLVSYVQDGYGNLRGSSGRSSYGNYIKLEHGMGYDTLYAHLDKGISVKVGDKIKKGTILGNMSDSGDAYGKHLHFEVFRDGNKINPTNYINNDLYVISEEIDNNTLKYKLGDKVRINGVYVSSTSSNKLTPAINEGTITRIVKDARNPYLLDDGLIGWVNDNCIIDSKYLPKTNYSGFSLVDALKSINVDSSYSYRSKLAMINGINNYTGTAIQNTNLLNLLKKGKLKH